MNDIPRLMVNLLLTYGLSSKEHFVQLIEDLAKEKQWDETQVRKLTEALFAQLELWNNKRAAQDVARQVTEPVSAELTELTRAIRELTEALNKKST